MFEWGNFVLPQLKTNYKDQNLQIFQRRFPYLLKLNIWLELLTEHCSANQSANKQNAIVSRTNKSENNRLFM